MWASIALIVSASVTGLVAGSLLVEFKSCETEFNRDLMENVTISLITVGNRNVLNGSLIHKTEVPSWDITNTLTIPQGKNRQITLLNVTLNGCEFIAQPFVNSISITAFMLNTIKKSIKNLPNRCPIKQFTEVVVSNLYVDADLIPFPIIPSNFDLTTIVSVQSIMAYKIHIEGVVGENRKSIV